MSAAAPPDLPLPSDWRPRRLVLQSVVAWLGFGAVAVRHGRVHGGSQAWLLDVAVTAAFVLAVLLSGQAFVRCVRQASSLSRSFLLRGGLLLTLLALLVPPFLSSDVFDYASRGRVEVLGHNPYRVTAGELAGDPAMTEFARHADWNATVMPYGPLAAVLQWLLALPASPFVAVLLWKLVLAGAHVATALLLAATARRAGGERDGHRALAAWLWNPWVLLESCSSAHNDALVALALAATCLLWLGGRHGAALLAWSLGALVKHTSIMFLPPLLVDAARRGRLRKLAAAAVLPLLLVAAAWARYWRGDGGFAWLAPQSNARHASFAGLANAAAGPVAALAVRTFGVVLALAVLATAARRSRTPHQLAGAGVLATVALILFVVPSLHPWYHLWWLPALGLVGAPAMLRALELLAFVGPLGYLVMVATWRLDAPHQVWHLLVAGVWPCLLVLVAWRDVSGLRPAPATDDAA